MNTWFRYFLTKAISQRRGRFILSSAAVMLSVAVVTALATISLGVRDKIGAELNQYGANMIVTHRDGEMIDGDVADAVRSLSPSIKDASFQVYGTAPVRKTAVEVIGIEPGRMKGFRVFGALPVSTDELMIGATLKDALKAKQGDVVHFDGSERAFKVTALFEKGSDEDGMIAIKAVQIWIKTAFREVP